MVRELKETASFGVLRIPSAGRSGSAPDGHHPFRDFKLPHCEHRALRLFHATNMRANSESDQMDKG